MDGVMHLTWTWGSYPAAALLALGLALALRGLQRCRAALPHPRAGAMQPLTWMRGFRLTIFGLAAAGAGAAWLWQLDWLLALSLAIGLLIDDAIVVRENIVRYLEMGKDHDRAA